MDWQTLNSGLTPDPDYPPRTTRLDRLTRVLDGCQYDHLPHDFSTENDGGGTYIPLKDRRPSVQSGLCRVVVDDAVALLFSEGHWPEFGSKVKDLGTALLDIAKTMRLNAKMIEAATRGAVGSVALLFRLTQGRPRVDVLASTYLTPEFDEADGETLTACVETFKMRREDLLARFPDLSPTETFWWWRRTWDDKQDIIYYPQTLTEKKEGKAPVPAPGKTVVHGLGFCPMIWIKNLPGGDEIDGTPTFDAGVISTVCELDYLLSQSGRGLKYSADPTLLIKEPAAPDGPATQGGAANALIVSAEGDAKLLEIGGTASAAVLEHAKQLRSMALERMHGNRSDADKIAAAQSGRAMEMMHQALIWLADKMRISYGEGALLTLMCMVCKASQTCQIVTANNEYKQLDAKGLLLRWPAWFAPTEADKLAQAQGITTLTAGGVMSTMQAIKTVAPVYDVEDVEAEKALIEKDQADGLEREKALMPPAAIPKDH